MPTKGKKKQDGGDEAAASRRDLVCIVNKSSDDRPYHIYAKSNNALIARVAEESQIDPLLNRLDESVFHRQ